MAIPLEHFTDDDFYEKGKNINTAQLLTEGERKLKAAQERKAQLAEDVEDPSDYDQLQAQFEAVKALQGSQGTLEVVTQGYTTTQEDAIDDLLEWNAKVMKKVHQAIRMRLFEGKGYDIGETPGRVVKSLSAITRKRLAQAKVDAALLSKVGLKDKLLTQYEAAIVALKEADLVQESKKPEPVKASKQLVIARGKLAFMVIWLSGIAESTFEDTEPEVAKLFRLTGLLRSAPRSDKGTANTDKGEAETPAKPSST